MSASTALDGRGAVHIDRIIKECIADRLPRKAAEVRIAAAEALAEVLDAA